MSNIEIAITQPRIARLRSSLVYKRSFITSQAMHHKCSRSKIKGQGHIIKCISSKKTLKCGIL